MRWKKLVEPPQVVVEEVAELNSSVQVALQPAKIGGVTTGKIRSAKRKKTKESERVTQW